MPPTAGMPTTRSRHGRIDTACTACTPATRPEDLPQTVTVFVRAADGACLTRTSFVYNPSDYPEEIYMALPALADSFWYGLDTQVCALPEE